MNRDRLADLTGQIDSLAFLPDLFDDVENLVFFIKDMDGRYLAANRTLASRCGLREPAQMIGRTPIDIFPAPLGASYLTQDMEVMRSGTAIENQLELHLYPDHREGWCMTRKLPLRDRAGKVIGLAGLSRDLGIPDRKNPDFRKVAGIAAAVRARYDEPLQLARLARQEGLSMSRLERHFRRAFAMSPRQMLLRCRIDAARRLLAAGTMSITDVALSCGYSDHSAFSRQFRAVCGIAPGVYRQMAAVKPVAGPGAARGRPR